ncbi:MAG: CheR family methyltransferase [Vicinamibacterales bacterium]
MPALARRPGPVRVLSVGCSTGAELYSVGMLLSEAHLLERATLVGIDCRADAVAGAAAGIYPVAAVAAWHGAPVAPLRAARRGRYR